MACLVTKLSVALVFSTVAVAGSNLPAPTSEIRQLEWTTVPNFTGYSPASATISLFGNPLLYGTPATSGGQPRELEQFDLINAGPICFATSCPLTTPLYPLPNIVLSYGDLRFIPNDIAPGTGVSTVNADFKLSAAITSTVDPSHDASFSAEGMPVLYTGDDPGGLSSYVYFRNADGTYSNTMHVLRNTVGEAEVQVVILDPPVLTLDVLGFANPGPNTFVTGTVPEPASWLLVALSLGALGMIAIGRGFRRELLVCLLATRCRG